MLGLERERVGFCCNFLSVLPVVMSLIVFIVKGVLNTILIKTFITFDWCHIFKHGVFYVFKEFSVNTCECGWFNGSM